MRVLVAVKALVKAKEWVAVRVRELVVAKEWVKAKGLAKVRELAAAKGLAQDEASGLALERLEWVEQAWGWG